MCFPSELTNIQFVLIICLISNQIGDLLSAAQIHLYEHIPRSNIPTRYIRSTSSELHDESVNKQDVHDQEWASSSTVVLVQVVFRHGDRSPTSTYPTDPHINDWENGLGQLTKTGMIQSFELGQYIRQRYGSLIGTEFIKDEVYVRSTSYERTLMTAECVCAGLFPVNSSSSDLPEEWPLGKWQPIPVQTVPKREDKLLHPADTCNYVHLLKEGILAMDVSSDHIIHNKDLMYKISQHTGMEINVNSLHDLSDVLFCQLQHNMSQPEWLTRDIQNKLLEYRLHRPQTGPSDVKYLSGTLLDTVIKNMKSKAENSSDLHKLYLYSAHDSTVGPLMSILGVDNFLQVPYSAAFFIELHLINGQYFVKLLYRNSTSHQPFTLAAERCELEMCPLKVFDGMHGSYILSDSEWNAVCPQDTEDGLQFDNKIFPVLLAVIVVLIGMNMFTCYKCYSYKLQVRQGSNQDQYGLVQSAVDSDNEEENSHAYDNGNMRRQNGTVQEYHDNDEDEDSV
ncbi:testicular acid phosphatase homolog [Plakobranchus ocellatus]|uniref:Testicular acid phosphatase homolog n=1 Tax=Plakobranchus ocellatus TaxID=259542 RepID=A0AAV3Y4M2_9GAST|nr:testicular acid phosphatase homolog [Plakobranchus ocellatus]